MLVDFLVHADGSVAYVSVLSEGVHESPDRSVYYVILNTTDFFSNFLWKIFTHEYL